jgi:spore maturation protein CgeB
MNPEWHKPLYKNIGKDLIVAGSFYDYRNYLVKKLLERNVDICSYGRKLPKWINKDTTKTYMNKFIVREEKSKIFGQGLACLNSTAMSEFNSLNCRAFEIAGAEGLHFLEYRPAVEACFDIDKEVKVFRSIEELMTLIEWAKNFPSEAQIVRKNARKRALFEHTYENRLVTIINSIK